MATRREDLYERDFYVWARRQAAGLKLLAATRPNIDLDWPHLIDEVNELATGYRDTCRSQLRRVIQHLLKLEFSPARDPRVGWVEEIGDARDIIDNKLSNTLRRDLRRNLGKIYVKARKLAARSLIVHGEREAAARLPAECPYTLDQLLDEDFYRVYQVDKAEARVRTSCLSRRRNRHATKRWSVCRLGKRARW